MSFGPIKVIGGPADLDGDLRHYRWFLRWYGQDFDLLFSSFEECAEDRISGMTSADREALRVDLGHVLSEVRASPLSEAEKVDAWWFGLGAEWWPRDRALESSLSWLLDRALR